MKKHTIILTKLFLIFSDFPIRVKRLLVHFLWFIPNYRKRIGQLRIVEGFFMWVLFIPFYFIDIIGLSNFYEVLLELVSWRSRSLTKEEFGYSYPIFRNAIRYHLVRVNEHDKLIAGRLNIAYVSFRNIHLARKIDRPLLIHELIHVWQYEQFGSVYICKALFAQNSKPGYNYGGRSGLVEVNGDVKDILKFNFEQQGDLVQDYFKLSMGKSPSWIDNNFGNLVYFKPIIAQLISFRRFDPKQSDKLLSNNNREMA